MVLRINKELFKRGVYIPHICAIVLKGHKNPTMKKTYMPMFANINHAAVYMDGDIFYVLEETGERMFSEKSLYLTEKECKVKCKELNDLNHYPNL
jgi:hypothetical protein